MSPVATSRKRLLTAVAVGAFALSGGSGVICAGSAFASSSGSATIHFSNASARSNACKANNIQAIYITVSDVNGHAGRQGTIDFTPSLKNAPIQVNLVDPGAESGEKQFNNANDCLLASTGTNSGIPAGKYQQLRVMVDTDTAPADNACSSLGPNVFNCVELTDNSFHALTVPSGAQTGIKIPSTKIARGGLTITAGQAVDLDIDIDGCRSIVVTGARAARKKPPHGGGGSPSYKLKPVLQAGEVSLNSLISGQVVLGTNTAGAVSANTPAVPIPNAAVWLESTTTPTNYAEGNPAATATNVAVDNVIATTTADSNGNFVFCPVPNNLSGLELVATASTMPAAAGPNPSDVTIATGVQTGANSGMSGIVIPLVEPASAPTATAQYTTQSGSSTAIAETIALGMTQSDGTNQAPFEFANDGAVNPTTTAPSPAGCTCPPNTDCSCVTLQIPPDEPVIGPAGGAFAQSSATGEYSLLAQTPGSGPGSCTPNNLLATAPNQSSVALTQPTLSFQGCQ